MTFALENRKIVKITESNQHFCKSSIMTTIQYQIFIYLRENSDCIYDKKAIFHFLFISQR